MPLSSGDVAAKVADVARPPEDSAMITTWTSVWTSLTVVGGLLVALAWLVVAVRSFRRAARRAAAVMACAAVASAAWAALSVCGSEPRPYVLLVSATIGCISAATFIRLAARRRARRRVRRLVPR